MENCVCILRNLSYHVHKEIPGAERFQEPHTNHLMRSVGHQKKKNEPDCFGGKKGKGWWSVTKHGDNTVIVMSYSSYYFMSYILLFLVTQGKPIATEDTNILDLNLNGT